MNLIFISQLCDHGLKVSFTDSKCFIQDPVIGTICGTGFRVCRLYRILRLHIPSTHTAASVSFTPPSLWHARLGHPSISRIKTLASRGSLGSVSGNFSIHCQHCTLLNNHLFLF